MSELGRFWISTGIAILALLVSALSIFLQRRDKRGRLVVSPSIRSTGLPIPEEGKPGISMIEVPSLVVHLANPGETPVNVRSLYLVTSFSSPVELKEHHAMYGEYQLPFTVEPQGGHDVHVRGKTLLSKFDWESPPPTFRARIHVHDELRKIHKSRPFEIDVHALREGESENSAKQLAGADAASARFHIRCSCAAPLSSRPLGA